MTKSSSGFDHNTILRSFEYDNEYYHANQMPERPSTQLTIKILLLNPNLSLDALTTKLRDSHNMELTQSPSRANIVVISGIPSSNGTTKHQILQVVQDYDPKAKLLS